MASQQEESASTADAVLAFAAHFLPCWIVVVNGHDVAAAAAATASAASVVDDLAAAAAAGAAAADCPSLSA